MNRLSFVARTLFVAFFAACLTGCGTQSQSRLASQLPTRSGPIAVEATVDGPGSISTSLENNVPNVVVYFGGNRQVVVEESRIVVDGETYPAAPAGTKKITIEVMNGHVTLAADGKPLSK
jgi:hypothetical protein